MSPQVEVQPLSRGKRRLVFLVSFLIFIVTVPVSVFYATGYRFDFGDKLQSIKRVGGLYVRNEVADTVMFVNDEPVEDMRVFQSAAYVQNLTSGQHTIRVQGDGVETWVKELPVYPHLVTEVSSFNTPIVPQIRLITPWGRPGDSAAVVFDTATSSLAGARITNSVLLSATTATSSLVANAEYTYVRTLLASSSLSEKKVSTGSKIVTAIERNFNVATSAAKVDLSTTTKVSRDITLSEHGSEVVAHYAGAVQNVPYYYCVFFEGEQQVVLQYGAHVLASLKSHLGTATDLETYAGERICRDDIRIDRLGQKVQSFDFYPGSTDLVLMHLEDGIYVVEIDDRGWQNTQMLYKGEKLTMVVDGGRIFVKDGEHIFELYTEIIEV